MNYSISIACMAVIISTPAVGKPIPCGHLPKGDGNFSVSLVLEKNAAVEQSVTANLRDAERLAIVPCNKSGCIERIAIGKPGRLILTWENDRLVLFSDDAPKSLSGRQVAGFIIEVRSSADAPRVISKSLRFARSQCYIRPHAGNN